MSNMSYCRFQNTSLDLEDCQNALEELFNDPERAALSQDEIRAAKRLIQTCYDILYLVGEQAGLDLDTEGGEIEEAAERIIDNANRDRE